MILVLINGFCNGTNSVMLQIVITNKDYDLNVLRTSYTTKGYNMSHQSLTAFGSRSLVATSKGGLTLSLEF